MITSYDDYTIFITGGGEITIPRGLFIYEELKYLTTMELGDICESLAQYNSRTELTKKEMYSALILLRRLDAICIFTVVPDYSRLRVILELENIRGD